MRNDSTRESFAVDRDAWVSLVACSISICFCLVVSVAADLDDQFQGRKPMLVLTRRDQETFFIGESEVKILSVAGDRVRIGIIAPKSVPITRDVPPSLAGRDASR